jgi:hypothetical protein
LLNRAVKGNHVVFGRRCSSLASLLAVHSSLSNLAKAAALSEQRERARDKVRGQTIQYSSKTGRTQERRLANHKGTTITRTQRAAAQTKTVQIMVFVRPANCKRRVSVQPMCVFSGSDANASGASVQ